MDASPDSDRLLVVEHACEATALWLLGDSEGGLQTLQRLETQVAPDQQTSHNLEIASFTASPSEQALQQLFKYLERPEADATAPSNQKAAKQQKQQQQQDNKAAVAGYAAGVCNRALLLILQQQHASALQLLEPFHSRLDSLRLGTALRICCLLLDCYLASQQYNKAAQLICFLEATAAGLSHSSPRASTPEPRTHSHSPTKSRSSPGPATPGSASAAAAATAATAAGGGGVTGPKQHLSSPASDDPGGLPTGCDGVSCHAVQVVVPQLVVSGQTHLKQVQDILCAHHASLPAPNPLHLAQYYKARLGLACGSLRLAKREVRGLQLLLPGSYAAALLRGQLDLLRRQPRRALKVLQPLLQDPVALDRHRVQLFNLLGVLHHQLGKPQLAAIYLQSALAAVLSTTPCLPCSSSSSSSGSGSAGKDTVAGAKMPPRGSSRSPAKAASKPKPVNGKQTQQAAADASPVRQQAAAVGSQVDSSSGNNVVLADGWVGALAADFRSDLLYNNGLQQLLLGNWGEAIQCFNGAAGKHYMQPLLWVRLAEACIGLYKQQQQQQHDQDQHAAALLLSRAQQQPAPPAAPQQQQQQQQQAGKQQKRGQQQQQSSSKGLSKGSAVSKDTAGAAGAAGSEEQHQVAPEAPLELQQHEQVLRQLLDAESLDPLRVLPAVLAASRAIQLGAGAATSSSSPVSLSLAPPSAGAAASTPSGAKGSSGLPAGPGTSTSSSSSSRQLLGEALAHLNVAYALLQDLQAESAKEAEAAAALAAEAAAAMQGGLCDAPGVLPALAAAVGAGAAAPVGRHSSNASSSSSSQPAALGAAGSSSGAAVAGAAGSGSSVGAVVPRVVQELAGGVLWLPVQHAILSNLAYVHLLRGDPLPALHAARSLLACSELSAEQHYLGKCYAAEALCMLGRAGEAAEQLQGHLGLFMDGSDSCAAPWAAATSSAKSDDGSAATIEWAAAGAAAAAAAGAAHLTGPAAQAALFVNLGTLQAVQGDLDAADAAAKRALACEPGSLHGLLLLVYLRLKRASLGQLDL